MTDELQGRSDEVMEMSALLPEGVEKPSSSPGKSVVLRRMWDDQLADYVRFLDQETRVPSQHSEEPGERVLFYWLRNQSSSLRNGLLLPEQSPNLTRPCPDGAMLPPVGSVRLPGDRAGGTTGSNNSPSTGTGTEETPWSARRALRRNAPWAGGWQPSGTR